MKTPKKEQDLCIIFSRYPRPGSSKTRLIPYLGRQGAADLQRRMTEKLAAESAGLAGQVHVELAMAGAGQNEMAAWLGSQLPWQKQVGADLGERMSFAFDQGFRRGYQRVVVVGADCPAVSTAVLAQAFSALEQEELVLGPTSDGGYYLIGLRSPRPDFFENISWGSDQVLDQTLAVASKAGLQAVLLASLSDVDRPEDVEALPLALRGELP